MDVDLDSKDDGYALYFGRLSKENNHSCCLCR